MDIRRSTEFLTGTDFTYRGPPLFVGSRLYAEPRLLPIRPRARVACFFSEYRATWVLNTYHNADVTLTISYVVSIVE